MTTFEQTGPRLRVGVVGCGLIAQVVHLPLLLGQSEQFDVVALCDRDEGLLRQVGQRFGVARRLTSFDDLLQEQLDAVFILTSGAHESLLLQALEADRHVFVEKPFCFDLAGGENAAQAAQTRGLTVMVGNQKRYDPAFDVAAGVLDGGGDLSFIRTTTLEGPLLASLSRFDVIAPSSPAPAWSGPRPQTEADLPGASPALAEAYETYMLDSLVHDVNLVRGLVDGPVAVRAAMLRPDGAGISAQLRIGSIDWTAVWQLFPDLDQYRQEFGFHAPSRWVTLRNGSPYAQGTPTDVRIERPGPAVVVTVEERVTGSFAWSYELQLRDFHRCVVRGGGPRTGPADGIADVALLQEIARSAMVGDDVRAFRP